eukprot:149897-Pleurochrysis_carterae.AAC.2
MTNFCRSSADAVSSLFATSQDYSTVRITAAQAYPVVFTNVNSPTVVAIRPSACDPLLPMQPAASRKHKRQASRLVQFGGRRGWMVGVIFVVTG